VWFVFICLNFLAYNIYFQEKNIITIIVIIIITLQLSISFFHHDPLLCFRVKMPPFFHWVFDVADVTKFKVICIFYTLPRKCYIAPWKMFTFLFFSSKMKTYLICIHFLKIKLTIKNKFNTVYTITTLIIKLYIL